MVKRTIAGASLLLGVLAGCQHREPTVTKNTVKTTSTGAAADGRNLNITTVVRTDPPTFIESAAVGYELGYDGNVLKDTSLIPEGQKPYLTMRLHESPKGLWARATWKDASGTPIAIEDHDMKGSMVVTFRCDKALKQGKYSVVGYWGGNIAVERAFEVVAKKAK